MVDDVQYTILELVIHTGNSGVAVDDHVTAGRIDGSVKVAAQHGRNSHTILHVDGHHLGVGKVEQGDVFAKRVRKALKAAGSHAVVRQVLVGSIVVQTVDILSNGVVGRREASIGAISGKNLVHAGAGEYVVKAAELIGPVAEIVFDSFACKGIQVRLVDVFRARSQAGHCGQHSHKSQLSQKLFIFEYFHCY